MKPWLAGLLADRSGRIDEQVLISLTGAAVFFGLEIYAVAVQRQPFDPLAFGGGVGMLLGATSAGFGLRARLTPPQGDSAVDPLTGHFMGGVDAGHSS